MGYAQTASDSYLDIAEYETIGSPGTYASSNGYLSNYYKYNEANGEAWLTLSVYGAFCGCYFDSHPQKWIQTSITSPSTSGNNRNINTATWSKDDIYQGSDDSYFTRNNRARAIYGSSSGTSACTVTFYVTNICAVKLLGRNLSTTYNNNQATKLNIYECTLNSDGSLNEETTSIKNASEFNSNTSINFNLTGLVGSKIYKVVASVTRGYLYEIGFQRAPEITSNPTSLNLTSRVNSSETMSFNVKGSHLRGDINVALEDANNVFSIAPETITQSQATSTTGQDVTVTFAPTSLGTFTGKVILSSTGARDVEVNITGTALTPDLIVDPESLTFDVENSTPVQQPISVLAENLAGPITVALEDENNVFSISSESVGVADAEDGTSVNVTFTPPSEYGVYTGSVKFTTPFVDEICVPITVTYYPASFKLSISSYGVSTLYLDYPVEIPYDTYPDDLLGVFFAHEVTDKELKMARIRKIIPANEGVVVEGNSGEYVFPRYKGTDIPPLPKENILLGCVKNVPVSQYMEGKTGTLYTLGMSKEGGYVGFLKYTGSTIYANKAFLIYEDESNANALSISGLGGEYTGISEVNTNKGDGAWYTIQGIRLNGTPKQHGIYIRNGKTVVVK